MDIATLVFAWGLTSFVLRLRAFRETRILQLERGINLAWERRLFDSHILDRAQVFLLTVKSGTPSKLALINVNLSAEIIDNLISLGREQVLIDSIVHLKKQ